MFTSLSKQPIRIFALGATLMSIPTHILALPDILKPDLKAIYEALKARDPKFNSRLNDAMDISDRDLCEQRHALGSPEKTVLAYRPTRTIGAVAQAIKSICKEDNTCIENELNGEFGEFIELMLNPKGLRKENTATNRRFHELYSKHADTLDLATSDFAKSELPSQTATSKAPAPAPSQPQVKATVPAPVKTPVNWQPEQKYLQEHDLTAQRLATFMRIVAANVNDQPDEQLRNNWNKHIEDAQKDAKVLYDTYCPYTITRRLSNMVAWGTLGISRLFSPSFAKCSACDTLKAIVDGDVFKQAEDKATMLVKGGAWNRSTYRTGALEAQVAQATNLPMSAMLNPAILASTVMN